MTRRRDAVRAFVLACAFVVAGAAPALAQGGDPHTLLHLRFENTLNGEQGETPSQGFGTTFEAGISGQGVLVDRSDSLAYPTAGNFNMPAGTIEFWIKPRWGTTFDVLKRRLFTVGAEFFNSTNRMILYKNPNSSVRFVIGEEDSESGQAPTFLRWNSNEWHYVAVTWTASGRMITYIDGSERINHAAGPRDTLAPIPSEIFLGPAEGPLAVNAVYDEVRVSDVARTPEEIAARYLSVANVSSLSLSIPTQILWKGWRIAPRVTATTNLGSVDVSPPALTWSSSNPNVATVNSAGQIVGVGAGSAVLTATVEGVQTSLSVNVRAPALEPRLNVVSDYLATPAPGALYEVPVVIFRYLPTADGLNLDTSWSPDFFSLNPVSIAELERRLDLYDPILKFMLEEGSRFRGYGSQSVPPSLGYRVAAIITVYEPTPPGRVTRLKPEPRTNRQLAMYDADWFQIFERFNMRDYVERLGVKEVWFYWGGVQPEIPSYDPALHPPENMREGWESNMSSPTSGDISNSNQDITDLPVYDRTYIVYGRNVRRLDGGTIHVDGHQLESMMTRANFNQTGNTEMFWQKFAGLTASGAWQRGRCGDAHHPPNALDHYEYDNQISYESDIMDWKPDGGQLRFYSASIHMNVPYRYPNNYLNAVGSNFSEPNWHIFWRQSMPGRGNTIPFGTNRMTNWWHFVGNWDAAVRAGLGLYEPAACGYTLSANRRTFAAGGGAGSVAVAAGQDCRWTATSNAPWVKVTSGDANNGDATVNFSVEPNTGGVRVATIAVAGQSYTVAQSPATPQLMTEQNSQKALALSSVTSLRDPFQLFDAHNFSQDQRTRVMLFAAGLELLPGEDASAVGVVAEDSAGRRFTLPVEHAAPVPNFEWLTQVNVRLPEDLPTGADLRIRITLRGLTSNEARLAFAPQQ